MADESCSLGPSLDGATADFVVRGMAAQLSLGAGIVPVTAPKSGGRCGPHRLPAGREEGPGPAGFPPATARSNWRRNSAMSTPDSLNCLDRLAGPLTSSTSAGRIP